MKTFRSRLRRWRVRLDTERYRSLARRLVHAIIRAELALIRFAEFVRQRPAKVPEDLLTVVVKTFERPRELRRLVRSIQRLQPGLSIVVADDSRCPTNLSGVETVRLPFNSGVSAGRNAALERVRTPYFLMLDDDFVLMKRTDLATSLSAIDSTPEIDVLGGVVVNLPDFGTADYSKAELFATSSSPIFVPGSIVGGLPVRSKVANFFIGRTESVRTVGWTDELKFLDHRDFFTRACGRLTTVQDARMIALHAKNPFDRASAERQANVAESWTILNRRYARTATDTGAPLSKPDP